MRLVFSTTFLTLLLLALKLTGIVTWPWVWVLSPFWIPLVFLLFVYAVVGVFVVLTNEIKKEDK